MRIYRAYKVRLYPNKTQEEELSKIIDGTRFVYNHYLEQRKNHYLENQKTLPYKVMSRDLTQMRKTEEFLSGIQAEPLQQSLRRLDSAYNSFFRKQTNFPKFHSRFAPKQSFQKHQDWKLHGNKIQIQRDLLIKYRGFIDELADLGTLIISKQSSGKWYASITATIEVKEPKKLKAPIGVDVGVETLATLSTGEKFANMRPQENLQKKLTTLQRKLARAKLGSNRRTQVNKSIARLYERIRNIRANNIHQVSRAIVDKKPSIIAVEDLNIKGMMKNRHLARVIADASMRELLRQLEYKQKWNGGEFVKIDRFFPSSKTCSECGFIVDSLPLSVRKWKCPKCEVEHDRDVNAAKMILSQASAHGARGEVGRVAERQEIPASLKRKQALV